MVKPAGARLQRCTCPACGKNVAARPSRWFPGELRPAAFHYCPHHVPCHGKLADSNACDKCKVSLGYSDVPDHWLAL